MQEVNILYAGGNEEDRETFTNYFETLNENNPEKYLYKVFFANTGQEFHNIILSRDRMDFSILDEDLSDTKATKIVEQLLNEGIYIKFVLFSANSSEDLILKTFRLGAVNFYRKNELDLDHIYFDIISNLNKHYKLLHMRGFNYEHQNVEQKKCTFFSYKFIKNKKFVNIVSKQTIEDVLQNALNYISNKIAYNKGEVINRRANSLLALFKQEKECLNKAVISAIEILSGLVNFDLFYNKGFNWFNFKIVLNNGIYNYDIKEKTYVSKDLNYTIHLIDDSKTYKLIITDTIFYNINEKLQSYFENYGKFEDKELFYYKF